MALGRRQQHRAKVLGMARNSSVIGWKWLGRAWGWESGGDPAGCGSIVPPPSCSSLAPSIREGSLTCRPVLLCEGMKKGSQRYFLFSLVFSCSIAVSAAVLVADPALLPCDGGTEKGHLWVVGICPHSRTTAAADPPPLAASTPRPGPGPGAMQVINLSSHSLNFLHLARGSCCARSSFLLSPLWLQPKFGAEAICTRRWEQSSSATRG